MFHLRYWPKPFKNHCANQANHFFENPICPVGGLFSGLDLSGFDTGDKDDCLLDQAF